MTGSRYGGTSRHYGKGSDGTGRAHEAPPPPAVERIDPLRDPYLDRTKAMPELIKRLLALEKRVEMIARELGQIRLEQENFHGR